MGGERGVPEPAGTANRRTSTSRFGVGKRENHDATDFYARFVVPEISDDDTVPGPPDLDEPLRVGDSRALDLPDGSVALVVTSPPYFAGKEYEAALGEGGVPASYLEYLAMLRDVFADCRRVLEPGGRIAVNVANLGRRPYRSLSADVIRILQDDLGLLLRGEVIWIKAEGASGSCAWGSFRSPANPVLRDLSERVVIASKGRFDRARPAAKRKAQGLPYQGTLTSDEFMEATLDVWRIPPESASRVGHPAPFPVELPLRLIELYTYEGDLVLDPFLGSGSAAVAAARAGRRYAGYDLDPAYVDIARTRVKAELESGAGPPLAVPAPARAKPGRSQEGTEPLGSSTVDSYRQAAAEGAAIGAIAERVLTEAGFALRSKSRRRRLPVAPSLVADDAHGREWCFELAGGFTVNRGGLARQDGLWRTLGRSSALAGAGVAPVVLLTSHLPPPGTAADHALRAVGLAGFFDAVELFDPAGQERLAAYSRQAKPQALPGFWREPQALPGFWQ